MRLTLALLFVVKMTVDNLIKLVQQRVDKVSRTNRKEKRHDQDV